MWKQRLHKCFHRACGVSLIAAALLAKLQAVDLTGIFKDHTPLVVSGLGVAIACLEFLPMLGQWLDGDSTDETPKSE